MGDVANLGQENVVEKAAEPRGLRSGEGSEGIEGCHAEMPQHAALARRAVEAAGRQRRHGGAASLQNLGSVRLRQKGIGHDDFAGFEPCQIGGKPVGCGGKHGQFARRNVGPGERIVLRALHPGKGRQIIVAGGFKQRLLGQRAGGDEAHYIAADDRLGAALAGLGRVLKLLAHRHPVALPDQALEILVCRMRRHPAHRNIFALMLAAPGQGNAQRLGGGGGIVEKQLVEIAHAVKQQRAGMGRLDLEILRHDRTGAPARIRPVLHGQHLVHGRSIAGNGGKLTTGVEIMRLEDCAVTL